MLRAAFGICVMCERDGRTTAATVADHIIPWQDGGEKYALFNGEALCAVHHSGDKQRLDRERRASRV